MVEEGYKLLTSIESGSSDFVCGTEFLLPAQEVFHRGEDAIAPTCARFSAPYGLSRNPTKHVSHGMGLVASQIEKT